MKSASATGESKPYPNLTMITSGIILLYSLLFFPICPSPNLASAIAIEFGAFLLIAIPIPTGAGSKIPLFSWPHKAHEWLLSRFPVLVKVKSGWRRVTILIAFGLICGALIDLSALWLAVTGLTPGSVSLYSALPISYLLGNHPALSLEMLTGACVESHQYERAEGLYQAVLEVRKNVYGPNHPMVAALYADLGDLNKKMNRADDAEHWYRASMAVTEGHGRAAHSLANILRDTGERDESIDFYKRALELRAQFFGVGSVQYQATLSDYQSLTGKGLNGSTSTR